MTYIEIIQGARADGVLISTDGAGNLKLTGAQGAVDRWITAIRENKVFILAQLCTEKIEQVTAPQKDYRKPKCLPSPVALKWLQENRQALDDTGWTRAELYRRNKSKIGLSWLDLWERALSLAYLHEDGTIEFECSIHGRDFIQTARPKRQGGKR